jgi:hypothetical protein
VLFIPEKVFYDQRKFFMTRISFAAMRKVWFLIDERKKKSKEERKGNKKGDTEKGDKHRGKKTETNAHITKA